MQNGLEKGKIRSEKANEIIQKSNISDEKQIVRIQGRDRRKVPALCSWKTLSPGEHMRTFRAACVTVTGGHS